MHAHIPCIVVYLFLKNKKTKNCISLLLTQIQAGWCSSRLCKLKGVLKWNLFFNYELKEWLDEKCSYGHVRFHSLESINIFGTAIHWKPQIIKTSLSHSLPLHLMLEALIFPSKPWVPNVHLVNFGLVPKTRGGWGSGHHRGCGLSF